MHVIPITRSAEPAFVARERGLGCCRAAMYAIPASILLWLLVTLPALGQVSNPSIIPVTVAPSGACVANLPLRLKTPDGTLYSCQNGTWGVAIPGSSATSCLAATTVSTPCVAYSGTFTALGVSGTTGVQTFYTANAPAGATFQFCPTAFIGTAGTAGTVQMQITYTTPGGQTRSASPVQSVALTVTGLVLSGCSVIAVQANSSLSFAVLAASGTGSPVWETGPVVTRLR
jgi:hypothetical protein